MNSITVDLPAEVEGLDIIFKYKGEKVGGYGFFNHGNKRVDQVIICERTEAVEKKEDAKDAQGLTKKDWGKS